MKKLNCSQVVAAIIAAVFAAGLSSCVNEEYDVQDINTEVTIAGEGLSLPLGSTKQLTMKDILSGMDNDVLQVLEGGAYAFRLNDTLKFADRLPNFKDMMNIPDMEFSSGSTHDLSSINLEEVKIDEQVFDHQFQVLKDDVLTDVNLPEVSVEHKDPSGVWEYGKAARDMELEINPVTVKTAFPLPPVSATGAEVDLGDVNPVVIGPESVAVTVTSECPEGISNISDVMMSENSKLEIRLSVSEGVLTSGTLVPDLNLDLGGLLKLSGDNTEVKIGDNYSLTQDNAYKASQKYRINEVCIEVEDWTGDKLSLTKNVELSGTASLKGAVADAEKLKGGLSLKVDIIFNDLVIESVMMDVDQVEVEEQMTVPVTVDECTLPAGVTSVEALTFTEESSMNISVSLANLADIAGLETKIKTLVMTFPDEMTVREAVAGKVVLEDIDLSGGFEKKLHIDKIDFAEAQTGKLSYESEIQLEALMTAGGRICSENVPYTEEGDGRFDVKAESGLKLKDYVVNIDGFVHDIDNKALRFDYILSDDVTDVGTLTLIPEGNPVMTIDFDIPESDITMKASDEGMVLSLPHFVKFKDVPADYGFDYGTNELTITGEVPAQISLPVEELIITPSLSAKGEYYLTDSLAVKGQMVMASGQFNGSQIEKIVSDKASVKVTLPQINTSYVHFNALRVAVDEEFEHELLTAGNIPEEIAGISEILLDEAWLTFDIDFDNIPDMGTEVPELDIVLTLPQEMILDQEDPRVSGTEIRIKDEITAGHLDTDPIRILAMDLSGHDIKTEGGLNVKFLIKGELSAEDPQIDMNSFSGDLKMDIKAGLTDIRIGQVKAEADFRMEGINESFELSGLPDFVKGEDFVLDLVNPHLLVKARSNMGIPVSGTLSITPVVDGKDMVENVLSASVGLPCAPSASQTDSLVLWFGKDKNYCPADYLFVEADLSQLINIMPDELRLSLEAGTDAGNEAVLDLDADYFLDVEYDFMVPLEFGEDLNIAIRDTLTSLPEIMGELLEKNSVQLSGSITSSLPLCLELEIVMLDKDGGVIPMEKEAVQAISSCGSDGSESTTPIELTLDVKDGVSTSGLDALMLTFKVTAPNFTGIPVGEDDFVQAVLKLALPEGITLDFAELNTEEN